MTVQGGRAWLARTISAGRVTAEQPLPWLLAAGVFIANALLTLSQGYWWLAVLEAATSLLAVYSGATVAMRSRGPGRSPDGG